MSSRPSSRLAKPVVIWVVLAYTTFLTGNHYVDEVKGTDGFAQHTNRQQKTRFLSGMHEPYMPTAEQRAFVTRNFPEYARLLPDSMANFVLRRSLHTPVKFLPLKDCPKLGLDSTATAKTIVVGGPPALLSSALERDIVYINDGRQIPIADGSAWHLEWDSPSEAPTTFQPAVFIVQQLKRIFISPEYLATAQNTGLFSWRSLDWIGWIVRPTMWLEGLRLAWYFQKETMISEDSRKQTNQDCAERCKADQKFFLYLDELVGNQLLLPGRAGSVIVARTEDEKKDLQGLKQALENEGRVLNELTSEDMTKRFGFSPSGALMIGEKMHDKTINPNFMMLLSDYLKKSGNTVIDGVLTTVYSDNPDEGGLVEFTVDGEPKTLPFSRLVLSLGSQRLVDNDNKPLLDIVAARGISCIALIEMPTDMKLPSATVCGATNHVTHIAGPVPTRKANGEIVNCYLAKLTCSACITPSVNDRSCADYDSIAATGLIATTRKTFGNRATVLPLTLWGCNRQVSRWGQSHWLELQMEKDGVATLKDFGTSRPQKATGVHVQLGAGGGGLTVGPSQPAAAEK